MSRSFHIFVLLGVLSAPLFSYGLAQEQPNNVPDTTARSRVGVMPLPILFYTPETGIAGGGVVLLLHRPEISDTVARPSTYTAEVVYTQKTQIIAEASSDVYLSKGTYRLTGFVHFDKYPQKFFGVGNGTPDSYEESYTSHTFRLSLTALRAVAGAISAGPTLTYDYRTLSGLTQGGMLQSGTVRGSEGGKVLGIGGVVQWDTRDNTFMPSTGHYYLASLQAALPGSDFRFSYFTLDVRHYLRVTGLSTFAVQAVTMIAPGNPPFYMLPQLGGQNIMRGYYEGRYRDKQLLAVQGEYRFPIVWRFRGAFFGGAGSVAPSLNRFALNAIKPSYGCGLRYVFDPAEKMCLRIDFAFGKGTSGMYITANEAI